MGPDALCRACVRLRCRPTTPRVRLTSTTTAAASASPRTTCPAERKLLDSLAECAPYSTVISTDPPLDSEAALLLARNVDAVLLLVPLGRARLADVKNVVEQVGRQRVVGAVSVAAERKG